MINSDFGILGIVGMATRAMSLSRVLSAESLATHNILGPCDDLKMAGIHTRATAAQVINRIAVWDRPMKNDIHAPMNEYVNSPSVSSTASTITIAIDRPGPQPTCLRVFLPMHVKLQQIKRSHLPTMSFGHTLNIEVL